MTISNTPVKGTRDYLPEQAEKRNVICQFITDYTQNRGFQLIETPILESLPLLLHKDSGTNIGLILKILKRGQKLEKALTEQTELADLGLRFDLTIPLCRYYAHNQKQLPSIWKSLQIGPVFRAENPQRGRLRQFLQMDIDIIGTKSILGEVEVIRTLMGVLTQMLPNKKLILVINSYEVMEELILKCGFMSEDLLKIALILDKLEKIGKEEVVANLEAEGFASEAIDKLKPFLQTQEFAEKQFKSGEKIRALIELLKALDNLSYEIKFQPTLARGMNYYTGVIFEVKVAAGNLSIAGGGRYDQMIKRFSGSEVEACGASIGLDRLLDLEVTTSELTVPSKEKMQAVIVENAAQLAHKLSLAKSNKELVLFPLKKKKLAEQLEIIKKLLFNNCLLVKENSDELKTYEF